MTRGCEWKVAGHCSLFKAVVSGLSQVKVACLHERASIQCTGFDVD